MMVSASPRQILAALALECIPWHIVPESSAEHWTFSRVRAVARSSPAPYVMSQQQKRSAMAKKPKSPPSVLPKPAPPPAVAKKKVLVIDDHPIVRERLAELINQEADLMVVAEAEDSHQARKAVVDHQPDIAIVDITLKDTYGIELIKEFKDRHPGLPMLVLSMHDEALYGERALRAGARGYLTKQEATKKVVDAIRKVLAGEIYTSEKMAASIL